MAIWSNCSCTDTLAVIGAFFGGLLLLRFARFVFLAIVTQKNSLRKYGAGKDAWAVVTGASGGIGKEFALELARRKMNVVIIARKEETLKLVAEEVQAKGVKCQTIAFDFSANNVEAYNKTIAPALKDLDIRILVNNVGTNVDYPEMFGDHTQGDFESLLNTNVRSAHQMTHLLLPKLVSARGAAVVNVSSQSATLPAAPMLSVYAGTKAYLIAFSKALATEYRSRGVDVTCITPSMVVSNMSKRRAAWDCPKPSAVVRPTLDSLGSGRVVFSPYVGHQIMDFLMSIAPASIVANKILALHKSTQKRAIAKRGERKK